MEEMPYLKKLKIQYKNDPDVVFVSLSMDNNISQWHKSLADREAEGYQWNINCNKLAAYNMAGIPGMLLIDKDFKMADVNAPLPSSPKAILAIDKLLK